MRKIVFAVIMALLINFGLVFAHEHDFAETKQLVDSGIGCDKLTDEQLEAIGDYYMEQMHPGEAHEMMDKMMGGEGSENLRQVHVNMAKRLYCNEDVDGMMGGGMMNMMMGNNMMGSGGMMPGQTQQTNMMGNSGYFGYGWNIWSTLYIILIVGLIILAYLGIIKLWRDLSKARRR